VPRKLAVCSPLVADGREVLPSVVDLAEERARKSRLQRRHVSFPLPDPPAEKLLAGRGYREVRRFHEMAIEFDAAPPAVPLPDGLTLETATVEGAAGFHAAIGEAFQDHWEFHPIAFEEWWNRRSGDPDFDIGWWFVVRQGEDGRCDPQRPGPQRRRVRRHPRSPPGLAGARPGQGPAAAHLRPRGRGRLAADDPRRRRHQPDRCHRPLPQRGMTTELESAVWERGLPGA